MTISSLPSFAVRKIEDEYGLKIGSAAKIDDGKYKADTTLGKLLIERIDCKETRLIFIGGVADTAAKSSLLNCNKIYRTRSGKCYLHLQDGIYIITDLQEGCRFRFNSGDDLMDAGRLIANFHKLTQGYVPPPGGKPTSNWGKWPDKYWKKTVRLKKYRDALIGKRQLTRFDTLFMENCGIYIERMEESVKKLKTRAYLDAVEDSMKNRQVCLCDLKQSNFIRNGSGLHIVSVKKCSYDTAETDIAEFYREYAKLYDGDKERTLKFLKAYSDIKPLSMSSIDIIKAFIIFPCEFEKICSRYYKGKDKWSEDIYISKLLSARDYEERKMGVMGDLEMNNY